jgi:hypothetical protein
VNVLGNWAEPRVSPELPLGKLLPDVLGRAGWLPGLKGGAEEPEPPR